MDDDVSVRVAVRIRPQIPREVIDMCRVCTEVTPGEPQITLGKDKSFTYDYVFDMDSSQEEVYETCAQSLINGALAGYNATVLAYGQTGSGKTYTMGTGFDVEVTQDQVGIIPRAIKHLFNGIDESIKTAQEKGVMAPEFKIQAQFMELYNEEIIDLFNPIGESYLKGKGFKIHEDPQGGIHIKGVTMRPVTTIDDALQCLRLGALSRTTASTQMNTQSSRSHAIFTLHIKQQRLVTVNNDDDMMENNKDENNIDVARNEFETLTAKFHFVDLAGSERLKRTGATGERAKEGISINCGLLALGNVISALGDVSKRALHVPYRDSKLTRLLQDSLGGNSQTVMIACISPSDRDFMETLNTLKYANRARNIKNKIMINQDKSSRTISILKQQIAQLQLELIEYKQGKRIVGDDGSEQVNDMFYENNMLQSEVSNLRTRIKAMQDTINSLSAKNTALLAEKATGGWITGNDSSMDVKDMVQAYLEEIENLKAKLMEANYTCAQLRKAAALAHDNLSRSLIISNSMSTSLTDPLNDTPSLIEEAKKELKKEKQLLYKRSKSEETEEINDDIFESESESDSESEKVDDAMQEELFNLTTDIDMKQKLITELELSQQRLHTMRQHYEDKLLQLQARIKDTQEERDKVLHSFSNQQSQPTEKIKKIRDEYERKLHEMQKELKRLQSAQKEHARLLKNRSQNEMQLKSLKNEVLEMKRAKVKLINKMKEETQKHKESELKRAREIAQLRKESRKNANVIRTMEVEKRAKEQVLRRKQEEVLALRRENRKGFSRKVAGRVAVERKFSPKVAKQKWINVEKIINKVAMMKQGLVEQELRMEQLLEKRESLGKELEKYVQKRNILLNNGQDTTEINNFIDDIRANINYIQDTISETQHNVMEIEESQESNDTDFIQSIFDLDEARYLIQKLFNMTINQSYSVAQRDEKLKQSEAALNEIKQENYVRSQLLDHVLHTDQALYDKNNMITSFSSNFSDSEPSSNNSSRSSSPIDNSILRSNQHVQNKNKIRRKTVQPNELLFGTNDDDDSQMTQSQDLTNFRSLQPIVRVPSAPGSLKGLIPLRMINTDGTTTSRSERKTPSLLSPRPTHKIPQSVQSTKHGSM